MFCRSGCTAILRALPFLCIALLAGTSLPGAYAEAPPNALRSLALERDLVAAELEQLQQTVELLRASQGPDSAAVQRLQGDITELKQRLIEVSRRQIALLETGLEAAETAPSGASTPAMPEILESKPLPPAPAPAPRSEEAQVARLHALLQQHEREEAAARQVAPSAEEIEQRSAASVDASRLSRIPFSPNKVRLSGVEGSSALAMISARLADPAVPESRRDTAPIASIKTYLFGTLIASESRSLKPVGKQHYVARLHLQPGDTTVRMQGYRWEISLPEDLHTREYLIVLYRPAGSTPNLHVFPVDEWLAAEDTHVPAWLPAEFRQPASG